MSQVEYDAEANAGVGVASDKVIKVWSRVRDTASSQKSISRLSLACARVCPAPVESSFVTSLEDDSTRSQHQQSRWMQKCGKSHYEDGNVRFRFVEEPGWIAYQVKPKPVISVVALEWNARLDWLPPSKLLMCKSK